MSTLVSEAAAPAPVQKPRAMSSRLAIAALLLFAALPLTFGAIRILQFAGVVDIMPPVSSQFAAAPLVAHIAGAFIYAILGAFQFSARIRRRWPAWHRTSGKVAIVAGATVAVSALWLTFIYATPDMAGLLLAVLRVGFASLMLASLAMGLATVRRRNFARHREWMIRAYALALGSATQMLVMMVAEMIAGGSPQGLERSLLMGLAWSINLGFAEWRIRRTRPPARTSFGL